MQPYPHIVAALLLLFPAACSRETAESAVAQPSGDLNPATTSPSEPGGDSGDEKNQSIDSGEFPYTPPRQPSPYSGPPVIRGPVEIDPPTIVLDQFYATGLGLDAIGFKAVTQAPVVGIAAEAVVRAIEDRGRIIDETSAKAIAEGRAYTVAEIATIDAATALAEAAIAAYSNAVANSGKAALELYMKLQKVRAKIGAQAGMIDFLSALRDISLSMMQAGEGSGEDLLEIEALLQAYVNDRLEAESEQGRLIATLLGSLGDVPDVDPRLIASTRFPAPAEFFPIDPLSAASLAMNASFRLDELYWRREAARSDFIKEDWLGHQSGSTIPHGNEHQIEIEASRVRDLSLQIFAEENAIAADLIGLGASLSAEADRFDGLATELDKLRTLFAMRLEKLALGEVSFSDLLPAAVAIAEADENWHLARLSFVAGYLSIDRHLLSGPYRGLPLLWGEH